MGVRAHSMELIHKQVPPEFVEMLPEGMKFIHRSGKEFLVVEEVRCPEGHSLMAESVRIHGEPSIRFDVARPVGTARIFVDSFWGSHAKLFSFLPTSDETFVYAQAICPTCGCSLIQERRCPRVDCESDRSIVFNLPSADSLIYVCARIGCPDHSIHVGGVPTDLAERVSEINYFGYGEDEQFRGI